MRGSNKLFNFFNEENSVDGMRKKGRSSHHNSRRNYALIHRYYFYNNFTKLKWDAIVKELSNKFYLSMVTIPEVIDGNIEVLKQVKKEKPEVKHLKAMFPYYNWSLNEIEFIKRK